MKEKSKPQYAKRRSRGRHPISLCSRFPRTAPARLL